LQTTQLQSELKQDRSNNLHNNHNYMYSRYYHSKVMMILNNNSRH